MKMKIESASPILGIDIAKAKFDACLRWPNQPSRRRTFSNDETGFAALLEWLKAHNLPTMAVGMEATGPYWVALACYLHSHQHRVFVLNPAYVKAYGQSLGKRIKNDRVDAALIADYVATHDCERWEPLPAEVEQLRELMRLYADAMALALSAAQRGEGLRTHPAQQLQAQLAQTLEEFAQRVLQSAREQAHQHACLAKPLEQADSVPGIGEITALVLVAELPRKRPARTVAGWAGVTPSQFESGTSVHKRPKMCKQGSEYVRQALYWPAITALRCCPAMQAFGKRLEAAGLNKMQIIGAVMHKLLRWTVGVINNDEMFDLSRHVTP